VLAKTVIVLLKILYST